MPAKSTLLLALIRGVLGLETIVAVIQGIGSAIFVTLAALALTFLPGHLAHRVGLRLPQSLLAAIALFVLASLYLDEVHDFYQRLWWWDLALHMGSAMGFGLLGFLLVFMLFEGDRNAAPPRPGPSGRCPSALRSPSAPCGRFSSSRRTVFSALT